MLQVNEHSNAAGTTSIIQLDVHDPDGIRLGMIKKTHARPALPPVLLIHGATFGAALFDLPIAGYSLMTELSGAGRNVYALDIRGYGYSLNGKVMNSRPLENPPFARLSDAVKDIGEAVQFILQAEQKSALDLIGFSWGTVTGAAYAAAHPSKISRLVLYAPLYAEVNHDWLNLISDPTDKTRVRPDLGAFRRITQSYIADRWDKDLGVQNVGDYRDSSLPKVIFETFAALDEDQSLFSPPAFRSPTGALADLVSVFNGLPLYEPEKLTMPTFLVRGSMDTTSTNTDARRLFDQLSSAQKEYCIVPSGSHFLCVEKSRLGLYNHLNRFLGAS